MLENFPLGTYFTPRHVIERVVQIVDPARGETIYDPAAGTAGFIVRAFEYVKEKIDREIRDGVRREQCIRELKEQHLEELLAMISVPKTVAGLQGAFRFTGEPEAEGAEA